VSKADYDRFSLTIPDTLNEWLYAFTIKVKKAGGYRIPKTLVVRAFIRAIKESKIKIDLKNIRDKKKSPVAGKVSSDTVENMLVKRIVSALKKN